VEQGLSDLARLAEVHEVFWSVLGPCLAEPIARRARESVSELAHSRGIDRRVLASAVRGARALVRQAVLLDLPAGALFEDARALSGGSADVAQLLAAAFDPARAQIRVEIIGGVLRDHGNILEAVDWRMEHVARSSRSDHIAFPIAVLSLRYRDGDRARRLTVQATRERLRELRAICDKLLAE
jgi:hypothetical protein